MRRLAILGVAALTTVGLAGVSCSSSKTSPGTTSATGGSTAAGETGGTSSTSTTAGGNATGGHTGNSSATGGANATGGGTAAAGSTALGCQTSAAPATALISDFSGGLSDAGKILVTGGGTLTYGTPAPTIEETNGALHVTLNATPGTSALYLGFGIYFNGCVDGHTYTGVKFDIGGTMTGCTMQYSFNFREDDANATDAKGSCTAASCYAAQAAVTVPATTATISIAYSGVSGGAPVAGALTTASETYLTGVQWQFTVAANATANCVVDLTLDNVTFY